MRKLLYLPFAILGSVIARLVGRQVFRTLWERIDEEPPPTAGEGRGSTAKVVGGHALQAAVMAGSAAAVDRALAARLPPAARHLAARSRPKRGLGERQTGRAPAGVDGAGRAPTPGPASWSPARRHQHVAQLDLGDRRAVRGAGDRVVERHRGRAEVRDGDREVELLVEPRRRPEAQAAPRRRRRRRPGRASPRSRRTLAPQLGDARGRRTRGTAR